MKYSKSVLSIERQLQLLQERGLRITKVKEAKQYLSNISYYRLRAYTYPYQNKDKDDHAFVRDMSFDDIIAIYSFDQELRLLVFDAIEKIEIAFRTQIIHQWAIPFGSHWHVKEELFYDSKHFKNNLEAIKNEVGRSKEVFIRHYREKYTEPETPPAWMSLEVLSLGLLSRIFKNLKRDKYKQSMARHFGLYDTALLENWMQAFTDIRNICAHHARLWNRKLTTSFTFPKHTIYPYVKEKASANNKLYSALCAAVYILNIIRPKSTLKKQLMELMKKCSHEQLKGMGAPFNWRDEVFWNS